MDGPQRIGIDTGGTFTDVVRRAGGARAVLKLPSTPDDPSRAVLEGLEQVGGLGPGGRLCHGSTVGTNTVLTGTGARVALVTTAGVEDVLHLGRGERSDLHALHPRREPPLVPRAATVGTAERVGADGRAVRAPAAAEARRVLREVRARRPEAVAVCLLHAARSPGHEAQLAEVLRGALAATGVSVHVSHELTADGREYERAATAVLDAYVAPRVVEYVERIARALPRRALTIMRSDGGRMTPEEVGRAPVRTLLSGPAAGVAAAHALARQMGLPRALSFDVGGTSTDVAWLEGTDLHVQPHVDVGPHRASVPSLALETVGAGGGSVVTLDAGGALRVGPGSAGADPGPACYGRGGPFALTDVWLLLDRLPDGLLDGAFALDPAAAERAARRVARQAGCSLRVLLEGTLRVAAATTARALRRVSVARGHDPRGAALVAFGGAGPMLAAETAPLLDVATVVVPRDPGAFAAEGALLASLQTDASRLLRSQDAGALSRVRRSLEAEVERRLRRQGAASVVCRAEVEARYAGQAFEVSVPHTASWRRRFHVEHAERYGFADDTRHVEAVRLRVRGRGREDEEGAAGRRRRRPPSAVGGPRATQSPGRHVARSALATGPCLRGPACIAEHTGTTWLPRGWTADVHEDGTLVLEKTS